MEAGAKESTGPPVLPELVGALHWSLCCSPGPGSASVFSSCRDTGGWIRAHPDQYDLI